MTFSRKSITRFIAAPLAALTLAASVAGCNEKVPVAVGHCTMISGSMVITGHRTIGTATLVCSRHIDDFVISAEVQFLVKRAGGLFYTWGTYDKVSSRTAPPAGDVRGRTYRVATGCLEHSRVRMIITIRTVSGLNRVTKSITYPTILGRTTGNCDS